MSVHIPASSHAPAGEAKRMEFVKKQQAEAKAASARFKASAEKAKANELKRAATMQANMRAKNRK